MLDPWRDPTLDALLGLDGVEYFVDEACTHRVRFVVRRVDPSPERPHGLAYSLTLHDERNERIIGFDNAHPVRERGGPSGSKRAANDHHHGPRSTRRYDYLDAASLLEDFWAQVDAVLREKGILP
ncbi:MAG: toxin-antitoxin system TumE family protein [Alphaproteobacteria bacterium]